MRERCGVIASCPNAMLQPQKFIATNNQENFPAFRVFWQLLKTMPMSFAAIRKLKKKFLKFGKSSKHFTAPLVLNLFLASHSTIPKKWINISAPNQSGWKPKRRFAISSKKKVKQPRKRRAKRRFMVPKK